MKPLDIAIALSTLEANPHPGKAAFLRDQLLLASQRQEITSQTYSEALRLLRQVATPEAA